MIAQVKESLEPRGKEVSREGGILCREEVHSQGWPLAKHYAEEVENGADWA